MLRVVILELVDDVGDVKEGIAVEPEVDEGRLHAGQDLGYAAFVDVPDDRPLSRALDPYLDDLPLIDNSDARLVLGGIDDDFS